MSAYTHNQTGEESRKLIQTGREFFVPNYKQREMILDHGKGSVLFDKDGNDYIDFGSGIAVCALGYGDKELVDTLKQQADKLWHTSNIFFTEPGVKLAEELVKASGFAKRVFFCNSGGEANEAAIKLARKYATSQGRSPEKRNIISFTGSFHGRTLATVTATAQPKYQEGFEPLPGGFRYCAFNDFEAIEKMIDENTCAVISEVVQGEGGIIPAKPGFLKHVQDLCRKVGAILILDQVQCGMGRTGTLFSHMQEEGVMPDVVSLAKGLGGGFPIGAMLVGERVEQVLQFGSHGTTFGGNPLATAVARVVLKRLQSDGLQKNVIERGEQLRDGLAEMNKEFGIFTEVRGRGLMLGAALKESLAGKAGDFSEKGRANGVLFLQAGPNVLRLLPPLVVTKQEVETGLSRMRAAIADYLSTNQAA